MWNLRSGDFDRDPVRSQYPASVPCHFTSTSHSRVSFQATMVRTKECLNPASPQYHQVHFTPSVCNADLTEDSVSLVGDTTQRPRSATNKPQNHIKKGKSDADTTLKLSRACAMAMHVIRDYSFDPIGFWEADSEEWQRLLRIAERANVPICILLRDTYVSQYGESRDKEMFKDPMGLIEGICCSHWDAEQELQEAEDSREGGGEEEKEVL